MYATYLFLVLISVTSGDYLMTLIVLVLGKGSIKKKNLEFFRFRWWVGLEKSIFQILKNKKICSKNA